MTTMRPYFNLLCDPLGPSSPTTRYPWTIEVAGEIKNAYILNELGEKSPWLTSDDPTLRVGPFRTKSQAISVGLRVNAASTLKTTGVICLRRIGQEPTLLR